MKLLAVFGLGLFLAACTTTGSTPRSERAPAANAGEINCSAPTSEAPPFNRVDRRVTCVVNEALREETRPELVRALRVLRKEGFTKPFGELVTAETKSDERDTPFKVSYVAIKTYSKEGTFGIGETHSIIFYVDMVISRERLNPAQIEIRNIVPAP